ncbi:MAG: hypothetical protein E7449_06265 [Ruminococcaceae bacterium]|nr:hypothetical protein [Oscillospiraceae bacterium]
MEEKEKKPAVPDVADPKVPPVNSIRPDLPQQRNIVDAYTDTVLSIAYYGKLKARKGILDSHMDEVSEGTYEF